MKLYEFSYTDKLGLDLQEVRARIAQFLEQEAEEQEWAPDYKFELCQEIEHLADNAKRYHFEVIGQYTSGSGIENAEGSGNASSSPDTAAASSRISPQI
jgi:hypothetical protein